MTNEEMALLKLRVELYGAAQILKGERLRELKTLVSEISLVLDLDLDERPAAKMARELALKGAIEDVRQAVAALALEVPSSVHAEVKRRVETLIEGALAVTHRPSQ